MVQFGFSRMTINRALRELTDEGRLVRLQGVGTFVAEPKGQSALFEVRSIAEEITSRHHQHRCDGAAAGGNAGGSDPGRGAQRGRRYADFPFADGAF